MRSTAHRGGSQGSLQRGELPSNVPEDDGEVGEGEKVGVDSPYAPTHASMAQRQEKRANTAVCVRTAGADDGHLGENHGRDRGGRSPDREGARRHRPAVSTAAGGPGDSVTTPVEANTLCFTVRCFTRMVTLGLLVLVTVLPWPRSLAAAPVPVRFAEGATHGFIVLRTVNGGLLASGDLFQVSRGGEIESRMVFRFTDGSVFDETVVFTQQHVFTLQRYRLVQRGPVFPDDTEISLERASGKYHVKTKPHQDGQEEVLEGTLELPPDVYNGMVVTAAKNLPPRSSETVHMVAFTPTPRLIQLELVPTGEHQVLVGELTKTAIHYVIKPQLGIWLELFAKLLGRVSPDSHAWIVTEEVPAFVRFEGPLFTTGPVWRIELANPRWPD